MNIKYWLYRLLLWHSKQGRRLNEVVDGLAILSASFVLLLLLYQFGFNLPVAVREQMTSLNRVLLLVGGFFSLGRFLVSFFDEGAKRWREQMWAFLVMVVCLVTYLVPVYFPSFLPASWRYVDFVVLLLIAVFELVRNGVAWISKEVSPTWLFAGSFLILILVGAGLLMLPRSTQMPITFFQAFFTSTSAVCVTGLTVVDTDVAFTPFGQFIIMILFQLGGIGVMTFTSFFALFFSGQSSFQNQLVIKDMVSADNLGDLFRTIRQIVVVTIVIEAFGAWLIYNSLMETGLFSVADALMYALFHSISAFCNAGFSTFQGNLANAALVGNNSFYWVVAGLVILGGIGFPLQANLLAWIRYRLRKIYFSWLKRPAELPFKSHLVTLNSRIIIYTTIVLLLVGTLLLFFTESNASLRGLGFWERLTNAFFWSVTPRTAGFNALGMEQLSELSVLLIILLMWIGASPMSTGGGIKTTTLALAWLNMKAVLQQDQHIDMNRRQIHQQSVSRAFAVIFISLLILAVSSGVMKFLEPDKPLVSLLFECCSALSTVGLSLNMTASLSQPSQAILIVLMFVGRIGILSFLMSFWHGRRFKGYRYPSEVVMV